MSKFRGLYSLSPPPSLSPLSPCLRVLCLGRRKRKISARARLNCDSPAPLLVLWFCTCLTTLLPLRAQKPPEAASPALQRLLSLLHRGGITTTTTSSSTTETTNTISLKPGMLHAEDRVRAPPTDADAAAAPEGVSVLSA